MQLLLGQESNISHFADRLKMSLRPPLSNDSVLPVMNQKDRQMISFLFSLFRNEIQREFWDQIFNINYLSQILNHQHVTGNNVNTLARKISSLRLFERFLYQSELLSRPIVAFMDTPRIQRKIQPSVPGEDADK